VDAEAEGWAVYDARDTLGVLGYTLNVDVTKKWHVEITLTEDELLGMLSEVHLLKNEPSPSGMIEPGKSLLDDLDEDDEDDFDDLPAGWGVGYTKCDDPSCWLCNPASR
jgi:hypothetical protein